MTDPVRSRRNNFDTMRVIAAASVLLSHSFPLSHRRGVYQPLSIVSNGQTDLGSIAVLFFFVISGYLITKSFDRNPVAAQFLKSRALRIFPGLFVVLFVTVTVLGPTMTSITLTQYVTNKLTFWYLPKNICLFELQYNLPGVFSKNPFPDAINGPIWTLHYELAMYMLVLLLGVMRFLTKAMVFVLWLISLFLDWRWTGGYYVGFGAPFLSGAVLYLWRDRVPLIWSFAALSLVGLGTALLTEGFRLAFATFGAYLVIFLAISPSVRLPNLARQGDLSYGIYIVGFPVQQMVSYLLGQSVTWYWNVAISLPVAIGLAWLSWHFIEGPALSLKRSSLRTISQEVT